MSRVSLLLRLALLLTLILGVAGVAQAIPPSARTSSEEHHIKPLCDEGSPICAEVAESIGYEGKYTGHDEPSLLFYSNTPGAGNSSLYSVTLPKEPPTLPKQNGTGGTFNFQIHVASWFGMALCDNQSAPEFTHERCKPNSDDNIFDNPNPNSPRYIGKHPGAAFLELQFYPPGWVSFENAISCDATKWCAAMAIFSLDLDMNRGVQNNADCLNIVGVEPANFAFVTKSGAPQAPPGPLDQTLASFTPDPTKDLFMNPGDRLDMSIHDSPAGLVTEIRDLTTGESGSMTASKANGFAQINFEPNATTCSETPYAFHPMYSTSSEHTRVPWAAHGYSVAFSDEIGHFEYCRAVDEEGGSCIKHGVNDPDGVDADDVGCFSPALSLRVKVGGCIGTDTDFDGVAYQKTWPGSLSNLDKDRQLNPRPLVFTSPLFRASSGEHKGELRNFSRVAFEADLPRIEAADYGGNCDRTTGANCVNPPPGANFYPIFSTRKDQGQCSWQLGGTNIPGTDKTFGGNSTKEFGPLVQFVYAGAGFQPVLRFNNFRRVLDDNPCQAGTG